MRVGTSMVLWAVCAWTLLANVQADRTSGPPSGGQPSGTTKAIRLVVEESYADCAGLRVPAVAQAPVVLLRAAGFSTSDTDTKQVRSELRVSVRGRSIAHSYGSSARFTGAAVKGSCSIRSGDISHASSFEGKIDRYDVDNWLLEDRYLLPREAPFGEAIARSG